MTLPAQVAYTPPYVADGVQTVFPYDFQVDQASELAVLASDAVGMLSVVAPSSYRVTGIGVPTGGDVTFLLPPAAGGRIVLRRARPYAQTTDYRTGDPFLAETHEGTYDDVVELIQQLLEELSRRPALPLDSLLVLRNLLFPRPVPLKLWGWDALGTGISYYDPAIVQVTPATVGDPGALAAGWYQSTVQVVVSAAGYAGQIQIPIPALYPSGGYIRSVTTHILTAFGQTQGLTTLSVGDAQVVDRWGSGLAPTLDALSNPGMFVAQPFGQLAVGSGLLTADGGAFDGTGGMLVTCHYEMFWPDLPAGGVVPTTGGWVQAKHTVTITASAGEAVLPIADLYPAGAYVRAVTLRITAGFGQTQGLDTLALGDATLPSRWGAGIAVTLGTVTNASYFQGDLGLGVVAATDGLLVAEGGLFDDTGEAIITCHYEVFVPDLS